MWTFFMGNAEAGTSDEEDVKDTMNESNSQEVVRVFQPQKLRQELENVVKHRIPSPTREAGDGMEASKSSNNSPNTSSTSQETTGAKLIKLPKTNIALKKLPPITDDKVKLPVTEPTSPLVPMSTSQPIKDQKSILNEKKPRFVPYEPYKAAVTPLVPLKKKGSRGSMKAQSPPKEIVHEPSAAEESPKLVREVEEAYKREINDLKKKVEETGKQLRIQTQVNSEVKKLLVASVGEDLEAKVDYLTQDKARLAADIRQYSSKISRDFEEKEQLSVQSDLWKSKFLASSVIVDELARWKATLLQRSEDCDHYTRLLVHEHTVLWKTMIKTQEVLSRLKNAFDPLNTMENATSREIEAASLLGLADLSLNTVQDLKSRLLGTTQLKTYETKAVRLPAMLDTPAEEGLKNISKKPAADLSASNLSDLASSALTGAAKPHLTKLGDQTASARDDFKCCTHCQGKLIHIV